MEIIRTQQLSGNQKSAVLTLIQHCQEADHTAYSYPLDKTICHYLLYTDSQRLVSVYTALEANEPEEMECLAFTCPKMRKKGYFRQLLDAFTDDYPETDVIFPVDHGAACTLAAMAAIDAECLKTSCLMELLVPECFAASESDALPGFSLELESDDLRVLVRDGNRFGHCQLASYETSACLHHVEIPPNLRRQGYGTVMLGLLLSELNEQGMERLFLHVAADNLPAVSLYEKTGFRITKTLSYYLY